jgi:transmembrane sensor
MTVFEGPRARSVRARIRALDEAMGWLLRIRDGALSERDLAQWTLWYESDERHKRAFDDMQSFWLASGDLATDATARQRLLRLSDSGGKPRPHRRFRPYVQPLGWGLALAASIALLAVGLRARAPEQPGISSQSPLADAAPLFRKKVLPDGSIVQLAPRSAVSVHYTADQRLVTMRSGEAYFSVVHNLARPFILTVNHLTIRDVGTAFNIRDAGSCTVVTVVRGSLEVVADPHSGRSRTPTRPLRVHVRAGEQFRWDRREVPVLRKANTERVLAWRQGRLEYVDQPLSSVIADVNRYAKRPVIIGDRAAGRIRFTGTVFTRTADAWVQALPNEFPVELISTGGKTLILASRPAARATSGR